MHDCGLSLLWCRVLRVHTPVLLSFDKSVLFDRGGCAGSLREYGLFDLCRPGQLCPIPRRDVQPSGLPVLQRHRVLPFHIPVLLSHYERMLRDGGSGGGGLRKHGLHGLWHLK